MTGLRRRIRSKLALVAPVIPVALVIAAVLIISGGSDEAPATQRRDALPTAAPERFVTPPTTGAPVFDEDGNVKGHEISTLTDSVAARSDPGFVGANAPSAAADGPSISDEPSPSGRTDTTRSIDELRALIPSLPEGATPRDQDLVDPGMLTVYAGLPSSYLDFVGYYADELEATGWTITANESTPLFHRYTATRPSAEIQVNLAPYAFGNESQTVVVTVRGLA